MYFIEKAAKLLNLTAKKVYKWGYDRKQVSRGLQNVRLESAISDYNELVDEILKLKAKEMNANKRKYSRRSSGSSSGSKRIKTLEGETPKSAVSEQIETVKYTGLVQIAPSVCDQTSPAELNRKEEMASPLNQISLKPLDNLGLDKDQCFLGEKWLNEYQSTFSPVSFVNRDLDC